MASRLWRFARAAVAAGAFFAALSVTQDAAAYCFTTTCDPSAGDQCRENDTGCIRDGVTLKWKTSPIVYRFQKDGSSKLDQVASRNAIRSAFDAWTHVQCSRGRTSLRFQEGTEIDAMKPLKAKQAADPWGIYFRDDEWPHDDANESIALTNQIYGKVTGTIDYADIEINTANVRFATTDEDRVGTTDLQAVLTHEVGHYIGLAHSKDPDSIMLARYCQAGNDRCKGGIDRARGLAPDDEEAVCAAYEPEDPAPPPVQTGGCVEGRSATTGTGTGELATMVGLGFLAAIVARRRLRAAS